MDGHPLERCGHITLRDPERKPFHHGGLSHAGLTGEDRVVLAAADQDIHHLSNLKIPSQHRVDLALCGLFRQVDGELRQGLAFAVGCSGGSGRSRDPCRGGIFFFHGTGDNIVQVFVQGLKGKLFEMA